MENMARDMMVGRSDLITTFFPFSAHFEGPLFAFYFEVIEVFDSFLSLFLRFRLTFRLTFLVYSLTSNPAKPTLKPLISAHLIWLTHYRRNRAN